MKKIFEKLKSLWNKLVGKDDVIVEPIKVEVVPVVEEKPKRARSRGKFKADDPTTPDVNEAWVGGKAPAKKVVRKKVKKPE